MNKQKKPDVSVEQAYAEIEATFRGNYDGYFTDYFEYYAYPQSFGNTGGPFCKPGGVYGQAFCTFTIEAWVCGKFAVLFCNGKVIKVVDNWDGVGSVRM
jgi:hypothetical protein